MNRGYALVGRPCTSEAPIAPNTRLSFSVWGRVEDGAADRYMYMISRELQYSDRIFLSQDG